MADETRPSGGSIKPIDSDKTQIDLNSPLHRARAAAAANSDKTQIDMNSPLHRRAAAAKPAAVAPGATVPVAKPGVAPAKPAAPAADKTQIDPSSPMHRAGAVPLAKPGAAPVAGDATAPNPAARAPVAPPPPAAPKVQVQRAAFTAAPEDPNIALPVGYRLMEYRVDNVLGQGGFGITYMATDVNLNSRVAIKEYLPEQFAYRATTKSISARAAEDLDFYQHGLESFLVEARTLATFRHPNIVRVARFFEANNTAYMVLEYERGKSFRGWWETNKNIKEERLLELLLPLIEGLGVVHRSGFLHRDIKPDNVIVRDSDGSLVLLDFGAARSTAPTEGEEASIVTPGYGPIEQYWGGAQGPYTDIYAFGATLYWMLTGQASRGHRARNPRHHAPGRGSGQGALQRGIPQCHRLGVEGQARGPAAGYETVRDGFVRGARIGAWPRASPGGGRRQGRHQGNLAADVEVAASVAPPYQPRG